MNSSHVLELRRIAGFLASLVLATTSEAALYTTSGNSPYIAQSWTDAIWQPGSVAPTSGNTYEILGGDLVQNAPDDSAIFPGDALTLDSGARLRLTGTSPLTLSFPGVDGNAGLILNGGRLQVGDNNTYTIDGQIAVAANSLVNLGWGSGSLVITAQISGGQNLSLFSWNPANSMDIQSANNPYSGNWLVMGGNLKGTGVNSLGTGSITIGNGTLEISYDIQTPAALTLLGSNSVMVLHQDCQFSAVTINGTPLDPGTYSYTDLAVQFPGNFAEGGSGSITIGPPISASVVASSADGTQSNSVSITSNNTTANSTTVTDAPTIDDSIDAPVVALVDTTAPTAPSGVTVLVDSSSITLSWNPSTDAGGSGLAGYLVYRGGLFLGRTTGSSYTDSGLTAGTQYCYTIVAYDNVGNISSASAQVCASTTGDTTPPTFSSGVTVLVNSSSQITLSWNPSTDAGGSGLAGYLVYRGGLFLGRTTGSSYTDSGLTAGTQYCYTIVAYDNVGNISSASAQVCATTLAASLFQTLPVATLFNEWYGPFASWTNVMAWGAACDGVTDDSVAVSNALAAVGTGTCSPVLLIPGMCRVTRKPWLNQRINVAIVGLNRDTCGFIYDGSTATDNNANNSGAASCFHIDGVANSYFARLTFNGNGKARTVLASSQQSGSGVFDNNNLFEDVVIKNAAPDGIGIDGGHFGLGFSNDEFVRCIIQTNAVGVDLENFNALDAWFTDCMFESNNIAINVAFGDAHAYHSFFTHNGIDFSHNPGAAFCSLVSNVSYQSGIFLVTTNQGTAGTQLLLKGNTVIDPSNIPYRMGQYGPVVMLDNSTLTTNATIYFYNGNWGDLIAVGNTNSISNWLAVSGGTSMRTNLVDNYVVDRSLLTYTLPSPPLQATNLHRTVFEMTTGVTSASLQSSINGAADGSVFHIPSAVFDSNHNTLLNSTVTIPPNKDVRIVGDGPFTRLVWNGSSGGTIFSLPYPSHATFSHIDFEGNNGSAGNIMAVSGVGSTSARVYLRASNMQRGVSANLSMGDCPNTVVDFSGLSYGATATPPFTGGSNIILGGRGKVRFIQSDGGNNTVGYICNNGGQLYVETSYNEAANTTGQTLFQVGGSSTVTFLDTKMVENIGNDDFSRATGNGFAAANLTGQLSFLNCGNMIDWFNITGASTGPIWIDGNTTFNSPVGAFPIINGTGDIPVQTMNYNYSTSGSGGSRYGDSGSASAAFTRQMLTQARAEYTDRAPMERRANQTDVLLEQVFFELGNKNLSVTP